MPADPWSTPTPYESSASAEATFLAKVYRWMAGGLALTGLFAYAVVTSPGLQRVILGNRIVFFGLVAFTRVVQRATFGTAAAMFLAYCALSGLTFSVIFLAYTRESIASTFFITGGTFAAMSAYGTLTKKDLTGWGQFLMMGLIGIVIALVVNIFLRSDALGFVLSCAGVVVFTGLTAYDAQRIKGYAGAGDERLALHGALQLYLDFVNLFLMLLRLFGRRR